MIFVTVGTDLPFDRMIKVIDHWASEHKSEQVFAQIGNGAWKPKHMKYVNLMTPYEYDIHINTAELIISHAGMGTILTALLKGKHILVMPKRACLGEHRSEHQLATAIKMKEIGNVNVALDESELMIWLGRLGELKAPVKIAEKAGGGLVEALRYFIFH